MRLQAAELFASGVSPVEVADWLRVSAKSAYAWRRDWVHGNRGAGLARCGGWAGQADRPAVGAVAVRIGRWACGAWLER
ncbi:helix-turn-helix domain-containing protein [Kibdelosporangium aridum]|uniref:helix-turn-helix domain-containing protein n=1 Tax=Kibdelosporangium aridum TaxID=2030 RepID=UPI00190E64E2